MHPQRRTPAVSSVALRLQMIELPSTPGTDSCESRASGVRNRQPTELFRRLRANLAPVHRSSVRHQSVSCGWGSSSCTRMHPTIVRRAVQSAAPPCRCPPGKLVPFPTRVLRAQAPVSSSVIDSFVAAGNLRVIPHVRWPFVARPEVQSYLKATEERTRSCSSL